MSLVDIINEKYRVSIKEKDNNTINTLRLIKSSIKDKEIALRSKQEKLLDKDILSLLQNMIKQRKDSIEAFAKANRNDLIEKEENEVEKEKNINSTLLLDPDNEEAMYMLIDIKLEKSDSIVPESVNYLENNGWEHYEVSNFAKPNCQSRMNQMVWNGSGYLGVGVGAHSYDGQSRWGNLRSLHRYLQLLEENCWPTAFSENLTDTEKANEFLMLQLRQTKGLSLKKWEGKFAPKNWMDTHFDLLRAWQREGLLNWMGDRIVLTKKGLLVADALTAELSF